MVARYVLHRKSSVTSLRAAAASPRSVAATNDWTSCVGVTAAAFMAPYNAHPWTASRKQAYFNIKKVSDMVPVLQGSMQCCEPELSAAPCRCRSFKASPPT